MFPVSTGLAGLIFIDAMSEIEIMTELKVTAMLGFFEWVLHGASRLLVSGSKKIVV